MALLPLAPCIATANPEPCVLHCLPRPAHAGFSLTALEQLLSENQQLATSQQSASAGAAEQASQLAAQLQQAQLENEALRQQLRRSESLRRKGQRALFELHQVHRWRWWRRDDRNEQGQNGGAPCPTKQLSSLFAC